MSKISRSRRAQIQSRARQVRQQGQLAGWSVARIAAAILSDLPDVRPLEAWRLAYGWSRPQVIASITNTLHVLDTIPTAMLRETSRQRLAELDNYLVKLGWQGTVAADLHERLRIVRRVRREPYMIAKTDAGEGFV